MTTTLTRPEARTSWAPLAVVLAGTFVTYLDFFIVNVALPSIQTDLHAGPAAVSLVVAGYGIAFAAGMITGGRLGDRHGRRAIFTLGLALFTATSLACGLAPTVEVLVLARVLQGASGALLTPQVLAIIGTTYRGADRARAFAAFGVAMGVAGVLGQLVGGALIAGLGWRAIFLVNVPVGVVTLLLRRAVPESFGARARLDLGGVVLGTVALLALVVPLVEGREHGWPDWTWACLAAAPVLAMLFVAHQRRRPAPLLPLPLFAERGFAAGTVVGLAFALVPSAFFLVLALHLQQQRGYGPLLSGVIFMAVGVGYFAAMPAVAALDRRFGRQVLALGAVAAAVGSLALLDAATASAWALLPGLAAVGFGIGLVLVPLPARALAEVDPQHAGAAAGALTTAQQVGGALGACLGGSVYFATGSFPACLWLVAGCAVLAAGAAQLLPARPTGYAFPTDSVGKTGDTTHGTAGLLRHRCAQGRVDRAARRARAAPAAVPLHPEGTQALPARRGAPAPRAPPRAG